MLIGSLRSSLLAVLILGLARTGPIAQSPSVDPGLRQAFSRDQRVVACVTLRVPAVERGSAGGAGWTEPGPSRTVAARFPLRERRKSCAAALEAFTAAMPRTGLRLLHRYQNSPCAVVEVTGPDAFAALAASPLVERMQIDMKGSGGLEETRALIHADDVFALGITGAGHTVAVLDTGVDHPDVNAAVVYDFHILRQEGGEVDRGPGAIDGHGHGTNVAGIIASRGLTSPRGVAPGAQIVAIKILDDQNRGFLSDWAAGVEHVVEQVEAGIIHVDAINMSLVSDAQFSGECANGFPAFSAACQTAQEIGIAVFASSGNTGSGIFMTAPACFPSVFSVGSVSDADAVSTFTSRNAFLDLLAPGEAVTSAGLTFTGTSQASPHAAAVACLVRELAQTLGPVEVLEVLQAGATPVLDLTTGLTFPRVDALGAITLLQAPDCNANGTPDVIDLRRGMSQDCNLNGIPDECDIAAGAADVNADGVLDACQGAFFHRGDPNASGTTDLSDAVFVLNFLFANGSSPSCRESADTDNNGFINLTDCVGILEFLFRQGPMPADPGPPGRPCAPDPDAQGSPGDLGCEAYERC